MFFSLLVTTCAVQGLRLQRWNKQNVGLFRQRYFDQQGRHQMRKLHRIQNRPTIETSRTITEVKEMQNGNTSVIAVKKQPAPSNDTLPQCYKPQCTRRKIKVKVYIKDDLWDKASQASPGTFFVNTVKTFFSALNKYLARLDNGGFEVVFNDTVTKLNKSDITFGPTYKDRKDNDTIKKYDESSFESQTFSFQEAVEKLPENIKDKVNIRILFVLRRSTFTSYRGFSEEMCVCNQGNTGYKFGCISVFNVRSPTEWNVGVLGAHEIGHTLGFKYHDNKYYIGGEYKLIMWDKVRNYLINEYSLRQTHWLCHGLLYKHHRNKVNHSWSNTLPWLCLRRRQV